MTYSQTAPPATGAPSTLKKPGTLLVLVVISAISALSGLIGAIYVFAGGRGLAESYATNLVTSNPEVFDLDTVMETTGTDSAQDVIELAKSVDMWDSVVSIAHLLIAFAAPLLLFTLFALKGATWARVLITSFAILSLFGDLATAFGYGPQLLNITGFVGLPTAIIAVVLCWLPANNRYAKARKLAA
ncbi:hypothetical protein [Saccharopolyspora spinosa]|uniref:hypothetical protein n=1 Tax=Saccharopolyspora spinosa TaxID=60894 RepID=UPI000237B335|nr:hypothetical protein [Saccharopolyspora spinosa]